MGTVIRSELSKNNPYYIPKHRYFELKHFCLQYKDFKKTYNELCEKIPGGVISIKQNKVEDNSDNKLYVRERYLDNIILIESCCKLTDEYFCDYILKAVTEGLSYSHFKVNDNIPCGKDYWYEMYRKFFYILSYKKHIA